MGNSLRCCLACMLPCGALDLIRIVHLNGYVEEITRPITAGEILEANPNHVLSKPCSQGVVRKIMILSPESQLKRGTIYFLIPDTSLPEKKKRRRQKKTPNKSNNGEIDEEQCISLCDNYIQQVVSSSSVNLGRRRHRRPCSKTPSWRPHLDSISEDIY